jgi:putative ABC transport system permease protein
MKTIGASSGQIARLYLFMIGLFCGAALLIGIPLSWVGTSILSTSVANLLNLELADQSIPAWVAGVQIVAGVGIPLLAVAAPVVRGSRLSVRSALDNFGVSATRSTSSGWVMRLSNWLALSETARLSVRNVFRQPARLLMTLGLLAAGGAMFMTALNVSAAWDTWLDQLYAQRLHDLEIKLSQPLAQPDSTLTRLRAVVGVRRVEAGFSAPVSYADTGSYVLSRTYPDKGHGSFKLQALPVPTQLILPKITAGSWLNNPQANDVVLNQSARKLGVKIGDWVALSVGRKTARWRVVGFSEDVGVPATAYVSAEVLTPVVDPTDCMTILRLAFTSRDKVFVLSKMGEIEGLLEREQAAISSSLPTWLVRNAVSEHMKILVNALLAMAVLMALVGSLALFSTMSMNVYERTREIGVMRAIGATPPRIKTLIVGEGLLIGFLSLIPALAISLVLSFYLGGFVGRMSFGTPLSLTISPLAGAMWISLIAVGSYLATLYPARRASQMTTREALAYE